MKETKTKSVLLYFSLLMAISLGITSFIAIPQIIKASSIDLVTINFTIFVVSALILSNVLLFDFLSKNYNFKYGIAGVQAVVINRKFAYYFILFIYLIFIPKNIYQLLKLLNLPVFEHVFIIMILLFFSVYLLKKQTELLTFFFIIKLIAFLLLTIFFMLIGYSNFNVINETLMQGANTFNYSELITSLFTLFESWIIVSLIVNVRPEKRKSSVNALNLALLLLTVLYFLFYGGYIAYLVAIGNSNNSISEMIITSFIYYFLLVSTVGYIYLHQQLYYTVCDLKLIKGKKINNLKFPALISCTVILLTIALYHYFDLKAVIIESYSAIIFYSLLLITNIAMIRKINKSPNKYLLIISNIINSGAFIFLIIVAIKHSQSAIGILSLIIFLINAAIGIIVWKTSRDDLGFRYQKINNLLITDGRKFLILSTRNNNNYLKQKYYEPKTLEHLKARIKKEFNLKVRRVSIKETQKNILKAQNINILNVRAIIYVESFIPLKVPEKYYSYLLIEIETYQKQLINLDSNLNLIELAKEEINDQTIS